MLKITTSLILFFVSSIVLCQTTISGIITDKRNNPIEGPNDRSDGESPALTLPTPRHSLPPEALLQTP